MDIANKCEIRVAGMQRSGNHAIINWIMRLCSGKICFLNNVDPLKNPYLTYKDKNLKNIDEDEFEKDKEKSGRAIKKDYLIYSYEEHPLQDSFNREFEKNHDKFLGKSSKRFDVLIIRDPYNFFASRIKLEEFGILNSRIHLIDEKSKKVVANLWKDYAKEYLGKTNYLKNNKIVISYNKWNSDKNYRKLLAKKFKLKFKDLKDEHMSKYGPGSSFDKFKYKGQAHKMKVLERWKVFKDYPFYRSIFEDKELVGLSDKIFGKIPGTDALSRKQEIGKSIWYSLRFNKLILKGRIRFLLKKILFPIRDKLFHG